MVTYDEVRSWFDYDPVKGGLVRKASAPFKLRWVELKTGYVFTNVRGKTLYQHRLVWLWPHGFLPDHIDHINMDKGDNRIENLRAANATTNKYNTQKRSHNTTGAKGVVFHPLCKSKPYQAKIVRKGRTYSLGYYATVAEAAEAYAEGAKRIAGEFARSDFQLTSRSNK